ncbi:MAG: PAS domain S-box protein [Myxococcota bacterium]|nr:PAS domain S-box protein [Myxococcota bacterium]
MTEVTEVKLKALENLIDELMMGRDDMEVLRGKDSALESRLDWVLSGLNLLVEVNVLRQLPTTRFQELLTAAVSTEWYDNIINNIPESILVLGRSGRVQTANRALSKLLDYEVEDLVGYPVQGILGDGHVDIGLLLRESTQKGYDQIRTHYRDQSGHLIPVEFSSNPILDDGGNLRAVVCVARDLRARMKTEQALRESERRYEFAMRAANDGLWEWNKAQGRCYFSPRFLELLAYIDTDAIVHRDLVGDLVHPDDQSLVQETLARLETGGIPFEVECRLKSCGGDFRFFSLRGIHVVDKSGALERVVGSARDITERRQTDDLRNRFIEKVISAEDAERRRIARELHDETSQSLTSVLVGLKAVEKSIPSNEIREQVAHLRALTARTIEEVGRLARGLHPSILDDLGFSAAIHHYATVYSKAHPITVDVHIRGMEEGNRLPLVVETTLYRILQEALTNVVKHARATMTSIVVDRREDEVLAIIEDDGCGIVKDSESQGVDLSGGLGLHGMRERAALLKGTVTVESTPEVGTTLYVHSPLS